LVIQYRVVGLGGPTGVQILKNVSIQDIIITIIISFMQGIYTYIPETNHVSMEYSVAATL
jgi:hypothetical protein